MWVSPIVHAPVGSECMIRIMERGKYSTKNNKIVRTDISTSSIFLISHFLSSESPIHFIRWWTPYSVVKFNILLLEQKKTFEILELISIREFYFQSRAVSRSSGRSASVCPLLALVQNWRICCDRVSSAFRSFFSCYQPGRKISRWNLIIYKHNEFQNRAHQSTIPSVS